MKAPSFLIIGKLIQNVPHKVPPRKVEGGPQAAPSFLELCTVLHSSLSVRAFVLVTSLLELI